MVYRRTERGDLRYHKRRTEIIAAARRLFAQQGYDPTTMQQVVREAGTSIGNCYFYFPNKEALLLVVVREIIGDIWNSADTALDHFPSGIERLAYIFYQNVTLLLENEEMRRLMLRALSVPAVRGSIVEDYRKRIRQLSEDNPLLFREDVELKIHAAHGAGIALVEMKLHGELSESPHHVGMFFARYTLRALAYPPEEIENAMSMLHRAAMSAHLMGGV